MATITRQIQIHLDRESATAECLEVRSYGANGWIVVNVTDSESVTVFLTERQMRTLAQRLTIVADDRRAEPMPTWAPRHQYALERDAIVNGQERSNTNGEPVAILERDGWFAVCEEPPDDMESQPLAHGWTLISVIEPQTVQQS